jgi:hypothetical protein
VSYVEPIVTAVTALAGGALGAWWQTRRATEDLGKRIVHERGQARTEWPAKHEWYGRYDMMAGRVRDAIIALQNQRRRNAEDPGATDFGRSENDLMADVLMAAHELGVAADHMDRFAPRDMMKKVNEVALQIGPAIGGRDGLPAELHVPMQQIRDMMRADLRADHA